MTSFTVEATDQQVKAYLPGEQIALAEAINRFVRVRRWCQVCEQVETHLFLQEQSEIMRLRPRAA